MAAHRAATHARQHLPPRPFGQIQIDNDEIWTLLDSLDVVDRLLAIREHCDAPYDAVMFECFAHQSGVRRTIFNEKN